MGIKDILSMGLNEFNKLKESQLRSLTNKLVSAANKRVRRFEAAGVKSPALSKVEQEGIFSTRNKSFNELPKFLLLYFSKSLKILASNFCSSKAGFKSMCNVQGSEGR